VPPNLNEPAMILKVEEDKARYLVKGNQKYYVYINQDELVFKVGDIIQIDGEVFDQQVRTFPYQFDAFRYQQSLNIHGRVSATNLTKIGEGFTPYHLQDRVNRYVENNFDISEPYIKTFILADKSSFEDSTKEAISSLGVAHLFAVSGLHISFLAFVIFKGLKQFSLNETTNYFILSIVLCIYLVLTQFSPSILRASLMVNLLWLNKRFKWQFTPFDLLNMLCVFLLLINPYYVYQTGFILTFLVSGMLLLSQPLLKGVSKFKQAFYVSLIAYLVTLPIITNFTHHLAPMTIFFNLIFVPYTMMLLLPMGYLTFILPFLESVYRFIIIVFEWLLSFNETYFYLGVPLYFPHPFLMFIYYLILFYMLKDLKRFKPKFILSLYLFLLILSPYLNPLTEVTFFNVHGDSILIKDAFNRCNVLIDTGSSYSENLLINSLKSKRIDQIDILFISHAHEDHIGALTAIIASIPIKQIITLNSNIDAVKCGALDFELFKVHVNDNPNNQSLIIKAIVKDEVYLFTGDIEKEAEMALMINPIGEVDYLKVAHHGAATSSHDAFLSMINPKEAIISVHKNNRFNHPHDVIIERLNTHNILVHRTDLEGTISFVYIFNKRLKKTVFEP
jgi:competence protein ComEC